ncbi:amidohydrolase [Ponticaulis sp.]|uniref:amidohydrolase family protein n=1 Tax=Ponticaulis sp. TaxID=2020902 RepID=UPI000B71418C|nr:amidohydrolase family protein [Ponticaulis sp.]MAI90865.1 amidohydrolase [Ponticaulis sp.]OUX98839.1 MAG: amidohydrolase [Hyphomonadaceae bacterium TMED5]|tara:strand:+ start:29139 stop:30137 length:999 start_codon:yes stop_codon:yes gene_type:complete
MFDRDEWLATRTETVLQPEREIVDPHHHLWAWPTFTPYLQDELWRDTSSGHNIKQTIYIECGWAYDKEAEEHFQSVGETRFVAELAEAAKASPEKSQIAAIIAHTDLRSPKLNEALDAHIEAGNGLLRGFRHSGACDDDPALTIAGPAPKGLYLMSAYQEGTRRLGERGLTFDSWIHHHQIDDLKTLARSAPGTTFIIDHFGTPLGVGKYAGKRDEIYAQWKLDIAELAKCPNVYAKLGGLAMPDNGWGYEALETPPSSDQLVADQGNWYHYTIDVFGPDRCMFESNFPVDRASISYHVLWNAFKKMADRYTAHEQDAMFAGTARKVYRLTS